MSSKSFKTTRQESTHRMQTRGELTSLSIVKTRRLQQRRALDAYDRRVTPKV